MSMHDSALFPTVAVSTSLEEQGQGEYERYFPLIVPHPAVIIFSSETS